MATNKAGSMQRSGPESLRVLPGSGVKCNIGVLGTPPLTTKWFKSKKEVLSTAVCSVIKDQTSRSLEIFLAKSSDSGDYVGEIQNDVGFSSCLATFFVEG